MHADHTAPKITTEDAVAELIRLREADAQERAQVENELREEIAALWLRVNPARRQAPWILRIFS